MNRAEKIKKARADKAARREHEMANHGGKSRYARKKAWLNSHTRVEVWPFTNADGSVEQREVSRMFWGFEIASPKPWR